MKEFVFEAPVKVYFGENGVEKHLANLLKNVGSTVMLAYGGGSIKKNGLYDQLMRILKEIGKRVVEFGGIGSNPTYAKVLEGAALINKESVDFVLAVGGGSVIDCMKIAVAAAKAPKDLWEMEFDDRVMPTDGTPFGVVLTLSGTGAEMNAAAGITNEERNRKTAVFGCYAQFAICDPRYLLTVPKKQLLAGAFDNLSHCMETYFGSGTSVSDRMNEAVMHDIVYNIRAYLQDPTDVDVLGNLMWDSSIVQSHILALGKGRDFQCHNIEHQLCAYTNCNHGMALAVIHPSYYRHIYKDWPEQFASFGVKVFDLVPAGKTTVELAGEAVEALSAFIKDIGLDTTFTQLGLAVTDDILHKVADSCILSAGNARQLTRPEVFSLLAEVV